jgi:4-oxalocrotonate tautomerase
MPIIRIEISAGRSFETKSKIAADITRSVVEHTGLASEKVLIFFTDIPRYQQAVAGKMRERPPSETP